MDTASAHHHHLAARRPGRTAAKRTRRGRTADLESRHRAEQVYKLG
ncbi:MAG TPA: hypothetical protein VE081_12255 [Sporichthyaceae bacterium]|nr:hypothetical protein [Sporichthyaceae bacterium]